MGCFFSCFDGGASKQRRREEEQLAHEEARAKAAEAAEKREFSFLSLLFYFFCFYIYFFFLIFLIDANLIAGAALGIVCCNGFCGKMFWGQQQFEQSAAGRAARAQQAAIAKQYTNTNKAEPALKWQMGS